VTIDTILKACIAFGVGAGLTLEDDRASVREDQPAATASPD
jgi:hypothetical protein